MTAGRKPSVPEPPTTADLDQYGPEACLAALREEFTEHHRRWNQYRGWTDGTVLGVVQYRIGGPGTFARAEPGDLVLVKRNRFLDEAYAPRVGWNVSVRYGEVRDLPAAEVQAA